MKKINFFEHFFEQEYFFEGGVTGKRKDEEDLVDVAKSGISTAKNTSLLSK